MPTPKPTYVNDSGPHPLDDDVYPQPPEPLEKADLQPAEIPEPPERDEDHSAEQPEPLDLPALSPIEAPEPPEAIEYEPAQVRDLREPVRPDETEYPSLPNGSDREAAGLPEMPAGPDQHPAEAPEREYRPEHYAGDQEDGNGQVHEEEYQVELNR